MKAEEKENWYAHYHLGLRYYQEGLTKKAGEEFKISHTLAGNAWALHGLACTELQTGSREKVAGICLPESSFRSRRAPM